VGGIDEGEEERGERNKTIAKVEWKREQEVLNRTSEGIRKRV